MLSLPCDRYQLILSNTGFGKQHQDNLTQQFLHCVNMEGRKCWIEWELIIAVVCRAFSKRRLNTQHLLQCVVADTKKWLFLLHCWSTQQVTDILCILSPPYSSMIVYHVQCRVLQPPLIVYFTRCLVFRTIRILY